MFHLEGFTKIQKEIVEMVRSALGDTPFHVEKTKKNHLKFLIEGVEKPMYTGGTPSDRKSIQNFITDIKRASMPYNVLAEQGRTPSEPICPPKKRFNLTQDDSSCVLFEQMMQRLLSDRHTIKKAEERLFTDTQSIEQVKQFRMQHIENSVDSVLSGLEIAEKMKSSAKRKKWGRKLTSVLDGFLPPLSTYKHELKQLTASSKCSASPVVEVIETLTLPEPAPVRDTLEDGQLSQWANCEQTIVQPVDESTADMKTVGAMDGAALEPLPIFDLESMGYPALKQLSFMVEHILVLQQQQAVQHIIQIMQEYDITQQQLIEQFNEVEPQ